MLEHSGKVLIKVRGHSYNRVVSGGEFLDSRRYQIEPLCEAHQRASAVSEKEPQDIWFLVTPSYFDPGVNPWDLAHRVAREKRYSFFAEPDLLQAFARGPATRAWVPPTSGLDQHWPPPGPVSPGWHLLPGFTDFVSAHQKAMGKGIRIAHLDTG